MEKDPKGGECMEEATETKGQSNKTIWIALAIVLLVLAGGAFAFINSNKATQPTQQATPQPTVQQQEKAAGQGATESAMKEVKTFAVEGSPFAFSVKEIRVKKGDTVKIVFTNKTGFHDWTVDEFNAKTKQIQAGETDEVTFVADKAGSFEYYCSVGTHRQQGMVGKLIVE
ncbi:MAG: cupredoxin domain-containing protein [Candidatus Levybacteria bacterium]|nr:cupredoxin domain-containing protein [Candidatus Levybacteria bacterium]